MKLVNFWDIPILPKDLRITIVFQKLNDYYKTIEVFNPLNKDSIAISCDKIYILRYEYVKNKISFDEYKKILIHETIHMLQMYSTLISPKEQRWLYEAIACYLAGQRPDNYNSLNGHQINWDLIQENIHLYDYCYELANRIGEILFAEYTELEIVKICKDKELAREIGEKIIQKINSMQEHIL